MQDTTAGTLMRVGGTRWGGIVRICHLVPIAATLNVQPRCVNQTTIRWDGMLGAITCLPVRIVCVTVGMNGRLLYASYGMFLNETFVFVRFGLTAVSDPWEGLPFSLHKL